MPSRARRRRASAPAPGRRGGRGAGTASRGPRLLAVALGLAAGTMAGCDRGAGAAGAGPASPSAPASTEAHDPRLAAVVEALEHGRVELAWTLLEPLAGTSLEARLAQARAALAGGDAVGALRELEDARRLFGAGDRLSAAFCEAYAASGEPVAAEEELREGLRLFGRTAALERARGVLALTRPGGGETGLAALESALALDPALPWCGFPLSQARILVGRQRLSHEDAVGARDLAERALEFDPASLEARELLAEARDALGDAEGALVLWRELEAEGRIPAARLGELERLAGLRALLEQDHGRALDHFREARRQGLDDEALGHGALALAQEAGKEIEHGIELYEAGAFEDALLEFRAALRDAPGDLEARNHEAVCLFRLQRYAAAGGAFEGVLEEARRRGVALPEPVHLNAGRAWKLAGQDERARVVLERYLADEPDGAWAAETREMLGRLDGAPVPAAAPGEGPAEAPRGESPRATHGGG